MSKKMLFALAALGSACIAGGADDVTDQVPQVAASSDAASDASADQNITQAVVQSAVSALSDSSEQQASQSAESADTAATQDVSATPAPSQGTILPGVCIDQGPISVTPSPAVTEQNISSLAEVTAEALKQSLAEAEASLVQKMNAGEDLQTAAVEVVSQASQSFVEFLMSLYGDFVEFLRNGWKYMIYHEIGGATRHILAKVPTVRSMALDFSSLEAVDGYAAACLAKMDAARSVIIAEAEHRSPALKDAAEACLNQYFDWFTGKSAGFVSEASTSRMLKALNLAGVNPHDVMVRNVQCFYALGGDAQSRSMYLAVAPSQQMAMMVRSLENVSPDAQADADEASATPSEETPASSDDASNEVVTAPADASTDAPTASDVAALQEALDEALEEIAELQAEVDAIEDVIIEEMDEELSDK